MYVYTRLIFMLTHKDTKIIYFSRCVVWWVGGWVDRWIGGWLGGGWVSG